MCWLNPGRPDWPDGPPVLLLLLMMMLGTVAVVAIGIPRTKEVSVQMKNVTEGRRTESEGP